jgi:hypothetical protein
LVPEPLHDFFLTSATVAGALIGLLFVVISVSSARLAEQNSAAQLHRIRAAAALTVFSNSLVVSLFALIPGQKIAPSSVAVSVGGLAFVVAALVSLIRGHQMHWITVRDGLFLVGIAVPFVFELIAGIQLLMKPDDPGVVNTLAILVVVFFMAGIGRSWELIGAPSIGLMTEVQALAREARDSGEPREEQQQAPD